MRSNAAEAMTPSEENGAPSEDTKEALEEVRAMSQDRAQEDLEWDNKRAVAELAAAAAEERKQMIETRDKKNLWKAEEALAKDMTHSTDEAVAERRAKDKEAMLKKSDKAEADRKKPWWKRLMDSLGG